MIIFDVETSALPDEELLKLLPPFEAPSHPGEFDPASVRYGNAKKEDLRAAKLQEARDNHAFSVVNYESDVAEKQAAHWEKFKADAALDPLTGQVLAIGYWSVTTQKYSLSAGDETKVLAKFWEIYQQMRTAGRKIVGCNSLGFDLPFIVRRSWILGVEVPSSVRKGRYFDDLFVDLRDVWLCGQRWSDCESSLPVIARALNCGEKLNGFAGGDFARLWFGTAEEREQAKEYLRNDVDMTAKVAVRLGVV